MDGGDADRLDVGVAHMDGENADDVTLDGAGKQTRRALMLAARTWMT